MDSKIPVPIPIINSLCTQKWWKFPSVCGLSSTDPKSIPDHHPVSCVQDMLNSLSGCDWFSELFQGKAFHHGFLKESSRSLTVFITTWGLYEWMRIPFDLSSAEFQCNMKEGQMKGCKMKHTSIIWMTTCSPARVLTTTCVIWEKCYFAIKHIE